MTSLRTLILATTALATLGAAMPAAASPTTSLANPYSTKMTEQSDKFVLEKLLADYRKDPSTFEAAMEYIDLNRPGIREQYLAKTAAISASMTTTGFGAGAIVGVGVAAGAAAYLISQRDDGDNGGPDSPSPEPPEEHVEGDAESFRTLEYQINYGLEKIGAAARYAQGPQGQGVKVSVLDTGIDLDSVDFEGKIDHINSHSYIGDAGDYSDSGGHGSHVSGTIGAAKNDLGIHGVAFGSDLVIFKGIPGAEGEIPSAQGNTVWGDAINRSVVAGASVMNNSWVYSRSNGQGGSEAIKITEFESRQELTAFLGSATIASFENAKLNDLLTVTATGNDGSDQIAVNAGISHIFDEFRGYHIAVTATDENDQIASFANRCGVARDFCLAAPGVNIVSTRNGGGLANASGTSMAAPHVTGAAAVLKSQNPELTAPEVSQILFDTATDLGAQGVDDIYGHGLLNLAEAQAPQGDLVIYQGSSITGDKVRLSDSGIIASSAMGAALTSALSGQDIMVGDRYDRGYYLSADSMVATASAALPALNKTTRSKLNDEMSMISSSRGMGVEFQNQSISYTLRHGELGETGATDTVSPLSFVASDFGADYSVAVGSALSLDVGFSGAAGESEHAAASIGFTADLSGATFGTRVGTLDEKGTVLGSSFMGAAGDNGKSRTAFIEMRGDLDLSNDMMLSFVGTRSETNFSQSGLISKGSNLAGTAGRVALSRKGFMGTSGTFTASVSTPLQVTSGELTVDLPQQRVAAAGGTKSTGVTRSQSSIDFESNDRPYDVGFSYMTDISDAGMGLMMNAGYRAAGAASTPFAGLSVSFQF